jgi:phosphate ABC transporter permease protein PstC
MRECDQGPDTKERLSVANHDAIGEQQLAKPSFIGARASAQSVTEQAVQIALLVATLFSASVVILVFIFVIKGAMPAISHNGLGLIFNAGWDEQLRAAFHGEAWTFGLRELIFGTAATTVGALVLAFVIGLASAIVLVEYAPVSVSRPLESVVRLLAGFPSVVFGLIGIAVLAPWVGKTLITDKLQTNYQFISTGQCLLTAIIVLTFMIMPFFVSVAVDSLRAVPQAYRLAGYALGMPRWRVATRIVLPSASAGVLAGLVLAAARGVGEAVALAMVSGATAHIPKLSSGLFALLEPVRTLAAGIISNGDASSNPKILSAMYACAALILMTTVVLSIIARLITSSFAKRMNLMKESAV